MNAKVRKMKEAEFNIFDECVRWHTWGIDRLGKTAYVLKYHTEEESYFPWTMADKIRYIFELVNKLTPFVTKASYREVPCPVGVSEVREIEKWLLDQPQILQDDERRLEDLFDEMQLIRVGIGEADKRMPEVEKLYEKYQRQQRLDIEKMIQDGITPRPPSVYWDDQEG